MSRDLMIDQVLEHRESGCGMIDMLTEWKTSNVGVVL